jgi:hypothetical protein
MKPCFSTQHFVSRFIFHALSFDPSDTISQFYMAAPGSLVPVPRAYHVSGTCGGVGRDMRGKNRGDNQTLQLTNFRIIAHFHAHATKVIGSSISQCPVSDHCSLIPPIFTHDCSLVCPSGRSHRQHLIVHLWRHGRWRHHSRRYVAGAAERTRLWDCTPFFPPILTHTHTHTLSLYPIVCDVPLGHTLTRFYLI